MEQVEEYRGLVYKTATLIVGQVVDDFDDVVQVLYIKVWRALVRFDPAAARRGGEPHVQGECRCARCRYVFMCLTDQVKDLKKKRHRGEQSIDVLMQDHRSGGRHAQHTANDARRSRFESRHGLISEDVAEHELLEEPDLVLPNTLNRVERKMLALMMDGMRQAEAGRTIGLDRAGVERTVRSLRAKLADWEPTAPTADCADERQALAA